MKTCPKCKLDYSDEFSFCEFDGKTLDEIESQSNWRNRFISGFTLSSLFTPVKKGFANNLLFSDAKMMAVAISAISVGFIGFYAISNYIEGNAQPNKRAQLISKNQSPIFVDTPKEALEFVESNPQPNQETKAANPPQQNTSQTDNPVRPGVTVYSQNKSQTDEADSKTPNPPSIKPQPKIQMNKTTVSKEAYPNHSTQPLPVENLPAKKSTLSALPQEISPGMHQGVKMELLNLSPRKRPNGVFYEITLSVQNFSGQLIQWEYVTITANASTSHKLSTTSQFFNRLGSPGKITFTLLSPIILTNYPQFRSAIRCSLAGKTINSSQVNISISIPVQT